jgi:hypothetical protein
VFLAALWWPVAGIPGLGSLPEAAGQFQCHPRGVMLGAGLNVMAGDDVEGQVMTLRVR